MNPPIKWAPNRMPAGDEGKLAIMSLPNVAKARFFHSGFPQYAPKIGRAHV